MIATVCPNDGRPAVAYTTRPGRTHEPARSACEDCLVVRMWDAVAAGYPITVTPLEGAQ